MERYALGLDLGPTSIGWAAIKLDKRGKPIGFADLHDGDSLFPAIGVRIFPLTVENYGQGKMREAPKNKKRRESRSRRRILRRKRARRMKLIQLLQSKKMIPIESSKLDTIQKKNPYELRAKAISEKIDLYDLGRIFLHFAKRRGFKSNRKKPEKPEESGKIKDGIKKLKSELGYNTLGEFWHKKLSKKPNEGIRNKNSYKWIAERELYRDELAHIWRTQQKFYTNILTHQLHNEISKILFDQIPFELSKRKKRKVIGTCKLIKGKLRCPLSDRRAQEFRFLQKVNDLRITRRGREIESWKKNKPDLIKKLSISKEVNFKQIRKILGLAETDRINFEYEVNDKLIGNEIDNKLKIIFGEKAWLKLEEEQKEGIWKEILNYFNKEEITTQQIEDKIKSNFVLSVLNGKSIENIELPKGYISYSKEALEKILPFMREGKDLYTAIQEAGFKQSWQSLKKLPLPDKNHGFSINNPTVGAVMFQLRKIVNSLISELGKPERIVVEFARDLKSSKERRAEIIKEQAGNKKEREKAKKAIQEYHNWTEDAEVSPIDIDKYRLWEEQNHYCPYRGCLIPINKLLSRETEIDHILPRSLSLDNSLNNKVVCFADENQDKGQRTPFDWLGENSERWTRVLHVIDHWNPERKRNIKKSKVNIPSGEQVEKIKPNKQKWERFFVTSDQIAEEYTPNHLLNDTSYISREVRNYLKRLYSTEKAESSVKTTKGGITAELRRWWDLNRILGSANNEKSRTDLCHHAIDAIVIAVTSASMIKNITNCLKKAWPKRRPKEIYVDRPWEGFELNIEAVIDYINISHRVQRGLKGGLHKETNFWKEENGPYAGKFITRKPLDGKFTKNFAEHICDETAKKLVFERMVKNDFDPKKAFAEPIYLKNNAGNDVPIKKIRVWTESSNMVPIRENIYVEPGSNHHVEIFEYTEGEHKGKRDGQVITMFEAVRRNRKGEPVIKRDHGPDKKFIFSLAQNEMFIIKLDGEKVLHRVQKITQSGKSISIILRSHTYGGKLSDYDKPPTIQRKSPNTLKGRKVTIDPLGRIRWAND